MQGIKTDLMSMKFGRLTVIGPAASNRHGQSRWLCRCSCGVSKVVRVDNLRSGNTKSCGCLQKELSRELMTKHGLSDTCEYKAWDSMKQRCLNENSPAWKHYGGRKITICKRWLRFENFLLDMGEKPSQDLSLDRINNNRGYFKSNCRWATDKQQANNRRPSKTKVA